MHKVPKAVHCSIKGRMDVRIDEVKYRKMRLSICNFELLVIGRGGPWYRQVTH